MKTISPSAIPVAIAAFAAVHLSASHALLAQGYDPALTAKEGDPAVEVEIERHENGQLAKRVFLKNGKAHGLWQEWDADGRPTLTADWRDGLGEGVWMYFHPNGLVRERSWVTQDVWHGPTEGWHANGGKSFEGVLDRGRKTSPFRYWAEDGSPRGPWMQLLVGAGAPQAIDLPDWPEGLNRWDFNFSRDFETLFFATGEDDGSNRRIMMRRWSRGAWQPPEAAPFSDPGASEGTPVVSYDGEWVYFSSDRHAEAEPENRQRDLYRASLRSGWKDVERVTNTPLYGEITLTYADDGTGVLWTDRRLEGTRQMGLYEVAFAERGASGAPNLKITADLNDLHRGDESNENYAVISRDGQMVVFANYNIDGQRSEEDLFQITRNGSGWSAPRKMEGGVNSSANETSPQLIDGGRVMLFVSSRDGDNRYYAVRLGTAGKR